MNKNFGRVLIINTGRLGDFVSSFVVINPVKKLSENVDIICKETYEDIVNNEQGLKRLSVEDAVKNKYDVLLDLTSTSNTRAISKRVSASTKIGAHRSFINKIRSYILGVYTYSFKSKPFNNIIKDYFPYAHAIGVQCDTIPRLNQSSDPELKSLFKIKDESPVIGVHISGTDPVRQLTVALVRKIIEYVEGIGGAVVLIGDKTRAEEIGITSGAVFYREETISELIATISQLDYLIGPDSGVLHLAAALNTDCLGLYSVNLSSMSGPPAEVVSFLELDLDCRPCKNTVTCEYNVRCMNDIEFSEVKKHIDMHLSG